MRVETFDPNAPELPELAAELPELAAELPNQAVGDSKRPRLEVRPSYRPGVVVAVTSWLAEAM